MTDTDQATITRILREAKHVAVVGLTDDPTRPSHFVPAYLQDNGYHIIPINPTLSGAVLGETVYPSLDDAPPSLLEQPGHESEPGGDLA